MYIHMYVVYLLFICYFCYTCSLNQDLFYILLYVWIMLYYAHMHMHTSLMDLSVAGRAFIFHFNRLRKFRLVLSEAFKVYALSSRLLFAGSP